jgi:hypothetical protein
MASLRKQTANSWQIRVVVRGERINLSLSDLTEWQANKWKDFVEAISNSINFDRPLDKKSIEWLSSLTPEQRKKLSDKGIIDPDPDQVEGEKETTLSEYLDSTVGRQRSDLDLL